jgi:hypothetical protein
MRSLERLLMKVERHPNGLIVHAQSSAVVTALRMADWGWTVNWEQPHEGAVVFEVKGSFIRDNAAAAMFELHDHALGQTAVFVEGWRGRSMSAIGGNVFNVGVKRFQKKALDKAVEILSRA